MWSMPLYTQSKRPRLNIVLSLSLVTLAGLTACAGRMSHPDTDANENPSQAAPVTAQLINEGQPAQAQSKPGSPDPRMSAAGMNARLEALEAKLASMNEKLDATRNSLDNFLTAHEPKKTGVSTSPTETSGTPLADTMPAGGGYIQDEAVQLYRKANILFESQKYPDANLAFSTFLEQYPDHPLAGSAQYHIGEGYFKQHQNKEALEEFQKVLTSYDRSSAVPQTLREMSEVEEGLGKSQEAARHRQQLLSLFPNSPAAQNLTAQAQTPLMSQVPATPTTPSHSAATEVPAATTGMSAAPAPTKRALDEPPPTAQTAPPSAANTGDSEIK
jgi:tol-pal system protein YbgF